jgi:hypothetical protein
LRWLVSVALIVAAVVVLALRMAGMFRDDGHPLPSIGSQQLLDDVRAPYRGGYAGTIATDLDLGLPAPVRLALAGAVPGGGQLVGGSHTLRYWYGGPAQQRVAVLAHSSELDVFRDGGRVWQWDSGTRVALRSTVPAGRDALPLTLAMAAALTPPQLVDRLLAVTGRDSDIALREGPEIADRPTYQVLLTPRPSPSRIARVQIDIDGARHVPLAVRLFARGTRSPVIDVGFTNIRFAAPQPQNFGFSPPAGATVRTGTRSGLLGQVAGDVHVSGSGWLTLAEYRTTPARARLVGQLLSGSLQRVAGDWGKGQLLVSPLLCALVTDDGRIFAGGVDPVVLFRAARR